MKTRIVTGKRLSRVVTPIATVSETDLDKLRDVLDDMDRAAATIARLAKDNAEKQQWLFEEMRRLKLPHVTGKKTSARASIERKVGNASNVIDPAGYHQMCKDDSSEFYPSIKVVKEKASQHFTEKELNVVTTHIPGKPKDPEIVIKYSF